MSGETVDCRCLPGRASVGHWLFPSCASGAWTLLAAGVGTLEAFPMGCRRRILRVRWRGRVRGDGVAAHAGLRPVVESIGGRREAIFGHVARMSPNISAHQALRLQVETSLGIDDLTVIGSAALVVPATAGSTNSARTISAHLLTYGEQPSSVVTLERRYGPRRLRDDDDDDEMDMPKEAKRASSAPI